MSGTRSLQLLLLSVVFCAGLALAASTAGISAVATLTQPKLNPPTVLWKAYPLRQAHTSTNQQAANNKPTGTRTSKPSTTSPTSTRTSRTKTRSTVEHGNRVASQPTSNTGGFPTVLVMAGVIGALLASTLLFVRYAPSASAGGYRRNRRPPTTKPSSRTARTTRPSPAPSNDKKHPHATRPVDEDVAAPPTPDQRETTDDLLEALWPNVDLVEDPERVSAPQSQRRAVKPVAADLHGSDAVRQPPQRREIAGQQFCEIRLWRGWVKYQLYVEVEGSPGAFVESPLFRLRNPMAPDDHVHGVLSDLLADLERSGWSVVDTGPLWYSRRLHRSAPP
jgi:hypothetical protein